MTIRFLIINKEREDEFETNSEDFFDQLSYCSDCSIETLFSLLTTNGYQTKKEIFKIIID